MSSHDASHFRHDLFIGLFQHDSRIGLGNGRLTERIGDRLEDSVFVSVDEWDAVLTDSFCIALSLSDEEKGLITHAPVHDRV